MKKMLLRTFKIAGLTFVALLATMGIITFVKSPTPLSSIKPATPVDGADYEKLQRTALEHLAKATEIRVIGYDDANNDSLNHEPLLQFQQWVKATYPLIAKKAKWEIIHEHSLLITLKGTENKAAAMFLGHIDVVPALDSQDWKFNPFHGRIAKDTLWGRGALDDKNVIVALLEAAEYSIAHGLPLKRTLIFAFGHDEETGGKNGAAAIAAHLIKNKIPVAFIADEGFGVMKGIVPGLKNDCAIIGLSEKGNVSIKLSVRQHGGHSAWPNPENATSILGRGLSRLENYQFPAHLDGPVRGLFTEAAPYMDFGYRALFSNLWITAPLVKSVLLGGEKTAAIIRTTHVTTIIKSGTKENVVPPIAEAIVNLRLFPGDNIDFVKSEIDRVLNDSRIRTSIYLEGQEATPISPDKGDGYDQLKDCIHAQFPETVVVPGLVITGTDCKNYTAVTNRMYRFVPFEFSNHNLSGIHGKNEYITRSQFNKAILFYIDLFQRL
jgi:carboxypeptidase PM20D1